MNTKETEALVNYLEFHLLSFVEETEQHIADPDVIGDLYNRAYGILVDIEQTMSTQRLLEHPHPLTSDKKT